MGEQGIISRVLGVRAGSVFTFGAATRGEETAPGQVLAGELRDIYRIEMVDQATQVYGVAGDPVAHSLSPVMMNAAFRRETVNAVYLALHAKSLKDLLACVHDIPIRGLSITMPYKQEIVEMLENSDPADPADWRLQYRGARRRWQALRLQYRRRRHRGSAGTAACTAQARAF